MNIIREISMSAILASGNSEPDGIYKFFCFFSHTETQQLWFKLPKCPCLTCQLQDNPLVPQEWLKPNMIHFKQLEVILPLMYMSVCVSESVCTIVYVSESEKHLSLLGQDDGYDDTTLKIERNYPFCFIHTFLQQT